MHDRDEYREDLRAELGYTYASEREVKLREWNDTREDRDFRKLVWRLQAKKYWAAKAPERKARIKAYRAQWHRENRDRVNAAVRRHRAKYGRSKGEIAGRKAKRAAEKLARHAAVVFTCEVCGAQWCVPLHVELPKRTPRYCPRSDFRCRNRARTAQRIVEGKCLHCAQPARPGKRTCFDCRSYPAKKAAGSREGEP